MQKKKESILLKIKEIARDEFIMHGFKNASIRIIALKSKTTLNNIYTYFNSKDELFGTILKPTLAALDQVLIGHNGEDKLTTEYYNSLELQEKELKEIVQLIEDHRIGLHLLLFKSAGSSYENFRELITQRSIEMGQEYLIKMKIKYPNISIDVSPFFINFMGSIWLNIMTQIITQKLTHEEIQKFIAEYIEFGTAGWQRLMKI